jgi:hypothetical protein
MKLWLLENSTTTRWNGYYDKAVVAAPSEAHARVIHPDGVSVWDQTRDEWYRVGLDGDRRYVSWANDWPSQSKGVKVTLIGTAKRGTGRGIILSSYVGD